MNVIQYISMEYKKVDLIDGATTQTFKYRTRTYVGKNDNTKTESYNTVD